MYKTWDNEYCRKVCLKVIKDLEIKFLIESHPKELNIGFNEAERINKLSQKIFVDFKELKELCEYGCVHNEFHDSINKILNCK